MKVSKVYLGDGAYAEWDGFHIWVSTPRQGYLHSVALDDECINSLLRFVEKCYGVKIQVSRAEEKLSGEEGSE